jgi:phage FluMu protein Com
MCRFMAQHSVKRAGARKVVHRYKSAHTRAPEKACSRTIVRATKATKLEAYCPGCNRVASFTYETAIKIAPSKKK